MINILVVSTGCDIIIMPEQDFTQTQIISETQQLLVLQQNNYRIILFLTQIINQFVIFLYLIIIIYYLICII